jgi:hypothetical protein
MVGLLSAIHVPMPIGGRISLRARPDALKQKFKPVFGFYLIEIGSVLPKVLEQSAEK